MVTRDGPYGAISTASGWPRRLIFVPTMSASTLSARRASSVPHTSARPRSAPSAASTEAGSAFTTLRSVERGRRTPEREDGVEHGQLEQRELVDGAQHRGAGADARGELGGVLGRRRGQVGPGPEQRRELLVGPAPELVGQRAGRGALVVWTSAPRY